MKGWQSACEARSPIFFLVFWLGTAACDGDRGQGAGSLVLQGTAAPPAVLHLASSLPPAWTAALVHTARPSLNAEVRVQQVEASETVFTDEIDAVIASDLQSLLELEESGRLQPLRHRLRLRLPPVLRSAGGTWLALTARRRVWAYDRRRLALASLPATARAWSEMAWRHRIGWAPRSLSFQQSIAALAQTQGAQETEDWLRLMQANEPLSYPSDAELLAALAARQIDVAWVDHSAVLSFSPSPGSEFIVIHALREQRLTPLVTFSGAAVLKRAPQPRLAEQLLEFLLGPSGQQQLGRLSGEQPLAVGSSIEPAFFATLRVDDLRDLETSRQLMRQAGVLLN